MKSILIFPVYNTTDANLHCPAVYQALFLTLRNGTYAFSTSLKGSSKDEEMGVKKKRKVKKLARSLSSQVVKPGSIMDELPSPFPWPHSTHAPTLE